MKSVELMAWNKEPLPKKSTPENIIIYSTARVLYELYNAGELTKEEAQTMKITAITHYETLKGLARSNSKIIKELAKATAPRAELTKKSKAELLDVIARIEGVVTGVINEYGGKLPEFLKMEE